MPRKKSVVPVADVLRAVKAFEKATGRKVSAVKHHPDGTFRLMTSDHASSHTTSSAAAPQPNPWDRVLNGHDTP